MLMDPRRARLRPPPGAYAGAAPTSSPSLASPLRGRWAPGAALAPSRLSRGGRRAAIDPDLEPLPRPHFRELGREAAHAVADLRWMVKSGPFFKDEGDRDSSAG
ncbi:hypothetical protein MC885_000234 [Smutsia gigantea]|nr:hypothetical protein MC885_000234 [Smutsia gigantea]